MPFPESPRVVYQKNPLDQVICQLRFPAILRIEAERPVDFQEAVRQFYPLFQEKAEMHLSLPPEIAQQVPSPLIDTFRVKKAYDFVSVDGNWVIGLTSGFLALTSKEYERWEGFIEHLQNPFDTLIKEYSPSFFTRVGLRYINIIRRSELGLSDAKWSELLQPYIAGTLTSNEVSSLITDTANNVIINLSDVTGQVRIQHGLVKDEEKNEICYLIDSDFFTIAELRTELQDVFKFLDQFNKKARRLFRWCITDRLHEAMEPDYVK